MAYFLALRRRVIFSRNTEKTHWYGAEKTLKCDSHCYCSDDGEEFSIAVFDGTNMKFGVDTEDAEVESVDIQGEEGIMASKNGIIQIAWANQELHSYFNVNGPESMREDLIKVAQGVKFSHKNGCVFPIQLSLYM